MADTSPLVNLDLVNKIYRTINAQVNERVYDPHYNSKAELGDASHRYVNAYLKALNVKGDTLGSGNISTEKLNNLTLTATTAGFTISNDTAAKTLTVNSTATLGSSIASENGAVTVKSSSTGSTTIIGPSGGTATLKDGICVITDDCSTANTASKIVQRDGSGDIEVTSVNNIDISTDANKVALSKGTASVTISASAAAKIDKNLTVKSVATLGSTESGKTGEVAVMSDGTEKATIIGPNGDTIKLKAGTCLVETDASEDPAAGSLLKIKNIPANTFLAGPDSGTADGVPIYRKINSNDLADAITGTSPIAATNINSKITITHDKKGPTVPTIGGDTDNQTPGFGGTFKVTSATVDEYGHTTAFSEHTVTIPSSVANQTANGLMSSTDKAKLDGIAKEAEVNQNAFSNITVGSTNIAAGSTTDTLTLAAGDNITLTADDKDNKITISSSYVEASGSESGIVNTGSQAFAGVKTFSDTTDSNENRTTGAVIISGGLSVGKNIYADAVHNAVWNDLADCIEVPEDTDLEFGYCYSWNGDKVEKTSRKSKNCIGIHSNTAGLFMGEKPAKTIQAAVAGFALAYTDKVYPEGTPLTWSDDGKLTKCSLFKRLTHPERVIATFYKEEKQETWHGVKVNNRHWVKVR